MPLLSTRPRTVTSQTVPRSLLAASRAAEWWGFKFSPMLAVAYATACLAGVPLWPLLPKLLLLLLACTVGACYTSLINDWTDRASDARSHKPNRLQGVSGWVAGPALGLCLLVGLGFGAYFWAISPLGSLLYGAAWVVYTLYSVPPFRLKCRGMAGALADALGAHVLPQLLTTVVVARWAGLSLPGLWIVAVAGWSLACGVRNILWHQLGDEAHDRQAGVGTFVVRQGRARALWVAQWLVLPVEVLGFATLLTLNWHWLPVAALAGYVALAWFRQRVWGLRPVVADPHPDHHIVLNEYYELFYPLSLLALQSWHHPIDTLVMGLHVALFGQHFWRSFADIAQALGISGRKLGRIGKQPKSQKVQGAEATHQAA